MEKSVEVLFTQEVLNQFLTRFELELRVKKLGDFENYVFEVYRNDQPFVLRITHSSHRSLGEIEAELDWMNYLNENGVNCPKVFLSSNGHLIERFEALDESCFFACLYTKAEGFPVKTDSEYFSNDLFHAWGRVTGHMHAVTKHYQPKKGLKLRPFWHEEELIDVKAYFPDEPEIIKNTNDLMKELRELPQTKDNFGLIHTDIHSGNFFYDGKNVHVFDFDDCSYHWFTSDIAIPLYYSIFNGLRNSNKQEKTEFAHRFLTHFTEGYKECNPLPESWEEHVPLFLQLRDITLYSVFQKKIAPEDRDERLNKLINEIQYRIIKKETIA
ncbi:Ser/Thr protein kinase RdoA (MazF antagonist) [Bacillus sp. SLBN-46]|uniref:phosphotransferase enzyme family protein n=1 Tax=Bacillus sp. SLBN-46 TaxID=3042283 RepID=UPI00285CD694|nr:phosphotransferase [Bacillus sp. SLBN-46]MDR6124394.1 Ser/Thr protein kinase RdoA (MazF antagonist) [Bacillus sp. SLBN-46]